MMEGWNDRLNTPSVNSIRPLPRLSFGAKFVAARRKREGLKP